MNSQIEQLCVSHYNQTRRQLKHIWHILHTSAIKWHKPHYNQQQKLEQSYKWVQKWFIYNTVKYRICKQPLNPAALVLKFCSDFVDKTKLRFFKVYAFERIRYALIWILMNFDLFCPLLQVYPHNDNIQTPIHQWNSDWTPDKTVPPIKRKKREGTL